MSAHRCVAPREEMQACSHSHAVSSLRLLAIARTRESISDGSLLIGGFDGLARRKGEGGRGEEGAVTMSEGLRDAGLNVGEGMGTGLSSETRSVRFCARVKDLHL